MTKRAASWAGGAVGVLTGTIVAALLSTGIAADQGDQGLDQRGNQRPGGQGSSISATFAIGLWGDLPYSDLQALIGVPNLLADMNRHDLAFTVHDGDLKVGSGVPGSLTPTTCSNEMYAQALRYFNALKAPAIFTPGDNDWTDCDRPANGGFVALERLDYERQLFFSTSFSLGQRRLRQEVQDSAPFCLGVGGLTPCVENRRWTMRGVTFATLNVQGSCNNLCDTNPDPAEWAARNQANIAWLEETFAEAVARRSMAIMLISQANPGWDLSDPTRAPLRNPRTLAQTDGQPDGFQEFLLALRELVVTYGRPVAYVHGDSHYFRLDKPFLDAEGRRLETFTRVETFGDNAATGNNDVQWVKVIVDPLSREVFRYEPQTVPGNRTAVPLP
jgi:hypothetical protein